MTYKFGFELEGYSVDHDGNVEVPPQDLPHDGYPGLVEVSTFGGRDLYSALFNVLKISKD